MLFFGQLDFVRYNMVVCIVACVLLLVALVVIYTTPKQSVLQELVLQQDQLINNNEFPGIKFFGIASQVRMLGHGVAAIKPFHSAFNGSLIGDTYVVRQSMGLDYKPVTIKCAKFTWNDGNPKGGELIPFVTENGNAEDPCGILLHGRPFVMFNDGYQMYGGYVDTGECFKMQNPLTKNGDHDGREKNWSPFVYNDTLHVLYAPGHVVAYIRDRIVREYKTTPPTVPNLCIRGGTQLVPWKNKLVSLFHMQRQHYVGFQKHFTYSAGILELEGSPPFTATRWSKTPLWDASSIRHKFARPEWKVSFPRHLSIGEDGMCTILAGFHDITDVVITINIDELLARAT